MKKIMLLALCLVSGYVQCAEGYQEGEHENIIAHVSWNQKNQYYFFNTLPKVGFNSTFFGELLNRQRYIGINYDLNRVFISFFPENTKDILQNSEYDNIRQEFVNLAEEKCPPDYKDKLDQTLKGEGLIPQPKPGKTENWGPWSDDKEAAAATEDAEMTEATKTTEATEDDEE